MPSTLCRASATIAAWLQPHPCPSPNLHPIPFHGKAPSVPRNAPCGTRFPTHQRLAPSEARPQARRPQLGGAHHAAAQHVGLPRAVRQGQPRAAVEQLQQLLVGAGGLGMEGGGRWMRVVGGAGGGGVR